MISLGVEWPDRRPGTGREGPRSQVQRPAPEHERPGAEVDHRADSFDIGGLYNYQMFPIWPTGNFQPVDRTKFTAWKDYYPLFTQGPGRPQRHLADFRAGRRPVPRPLPRPGGLSGGIGKSTGLPLTKEGPTNNTQLVQWWNEKTNSPTAASRSRST